MPSTPLAPSTRRARRAAQSHRTRRRALAPLAIGATALGILSLAGFSSATPSLEAQAQPEVAPVYLPVAVVTPISDDSAQAEALDEDVEAAVAAAGEALDAATSIEDDIAKADDDLDLGDAPESVDTDELEDLVERVDAASEVDHFLLDLTGETHAAAKAVQAEAKDLRENLKEAKAKKKAEEEAARKKAEEEARKKAEAEAAAAAAAEASNNSSSNTAPAPAPAPAVSVDPGSAQAIAYDMVRSRGWGDAEFNCLVALWNKESGWRVNAMNPYSGAYGIPQALPGNKMATAGADWQTSAATQITWGLGYIQGRYGTPCGAWGHSQAVGWY